MNKSQMVWNGAAGIIIKDDKILMVKEKESLCWSIPSGGVEKNESPEQACIREVWEETGFKTEVKKVLHIKKAVIKNYNVTTHYFLCEIIDGQVTYHDPDDSIEEIAWKTYEDIKTLKHDYPEDKEMLLSFIKRKSIGI